MDYYSKYLKYKAKYLELKGQLGGEYGKCGDYEKGKRCKCKSYIGESPNQNNYNPKCTNCTHYFGVHLRK